MNRRSQRIKQWLNQARPPVVPPSFPLRSISLPLNASKSFFFDYFCRFCTILEDIFLPCSVKKQLTTAVSPFTLRLTILCPILVKNKEEHAHAKPPGSFSGLFLYACSRHFSGDDAFLLCGHGRTAGRRKHNNPHKAAHQYRDWHRDRGQWRGRSRIETSAFRTNDWRWQ